MGSERCETVRFLSAHGQPCLRSSGDKTHQRLQVREELSLSLPLVHINYEEHVMN